MNWCSQDVCALDKALAAGEVAAVDGVFEFYRTEKGMEKELLAFVRKWIKDKEVRSGESAYQSDSINEELPEFLIGCAEIVGYHKDGES